MNITDTLIERGLRYGKFADNATLAQSLRNLMRTANGWYNMPDTQREALDNIMGKIARQINGAKDYPDNFHDIAGYAMLAEQEILSQQLWEKSEGEADILANLR